MLEFKFTSEAVCEGHPDKLCDQISDSILDACLTVDGNAKVACECAVKSDKIFVFGEITVNGVVDYQKVIKDTIKNIGFNDISKGLNYESVDIITQIDDQSPEIAAGVHKDKNIEEIGAGDQGLVFGYACNETEEYMPLTHYLATNLAKRLAEVRKNKILDWVRPDGKTQVTVNYIENDNGEIVSQYVDTIVISVQHNPGIEHSQICEDLKREVIFPVVPKKYLNESTKYILNPTGSFVVGGPLGDAGLTGRKIIVDTYGGWGSHGGGAFSGKDATKVDRSAAYGARQAAKSLVANGFCDRVLLQISYAIGVVNPVSLYVNSYKTVKAPYNDAYLCKIIEKNFDFRPGALIKSLSLRMPIFLQTASYGHFGNKNFSWEQIKDLSHEIRNYD